MFMRKAWCPSCLITVHRSCDMDNSAVLAMLCVHTHLSTTFMSVHRSDHPTQVDCRYLLPPIIFYAGISVKKKQFFRNFASIAIFGVLGTYIAFAVIACVLYAFSKLPNVLNFSVSNTALLFATMFTIWHLRSTISAGKQM